MLSEIASTCRIDPRTRPLRYEAVRLPGPDKNWRLFAEFVPDVDAITALDLLHSLVTARFVEKQLPVLVGQRKELLVGQNLEPFARPCGQFHNLEPNIQSTRGKSTAPVLVHLTVATGRMLASVQTKRLGNSS